MTQCYISQFFEDGKATDIIGQSDSLIDAMLLTWNQKKYAELWQGHIWYGTAQTLSDGTQVAHLRMSRVMVFPARYQLP